MDTGIEDLRLKIADWIADGPMPIGDGPIANSNDYHLPIIDCQCSIAATPRPLVSRRRHWS
jgi:hypothetical protein